MKRPTIESTAALRVNLKCLHMSARYNTGFAQRKSSHLEGWCYHKFTPFDRWSPYKSPGIKRVSQMSNPSERKHTFASQWAN